MAKKDIEIPFGAYDSELDSFEYTIPEGYEAEIKDGKVVVRKTESKDEKIRKAIIDFFNEPGRKRYILNGGFTVYDIIAWLEKQGKNNMGISEAVKQKLEDNLNKALEKETPQSCNKFLDEQGEQKPAEWDILSAKKGDMLSDGTIVLIVDSIEEFEEKPIINSWYFADSEKFYGKGTSKCDRWNVDGFRAATKIECYYLLKMMADAGYEWDTEKKELKKIEQKPAWSEEDEKHLNRAINILDASKVYTKSPDKYEDTINWLKSLKERYTWKPSDEQMELLKEVQQALLGKDCHNRFVNFMYELKSLMEE